MTKTLTEQWREGKLPEDTYYVRFICGRYGVYEFEQYKGFGFDNDFAYIKEVLAPVPSYDKIKRLQEQLKEANDLLKGLYDDSPCQFDHNGYCQEHGSTDGNYICVQGELKEYLERYGVK